jgi:pantothenate synthetase
MIVIDSFDPNRITGGMVCDIDADRSVAVVRAANGFAILSRNGAAQQRMAFSREGALALLSALTAALDQAEPDTHD